MALVLGTLEMQVLFLVLSWTLALDKAHHVRSSEVLYAMKIKTPPSQIGFVVQYPNFHALTLA